ncbi:MAG: RecQ family ATP-dependent DNA helicase [Bacteroidia bacterium]|nr:RecQ family ATP-dependent DNA helicase [Bacteroidota bacterium]MBP6412682.1 RecQ family ATP-dependent DNA helicase [Bacteroidia bacterium]
MQSIHQLLKHYWGHSTFRPLQENIIQSILDGTDTLALLPTGGGKSICFQVPALAMDGVCVVISPLIALMKDQVDNLTKRGIKACAVYSGMKKQEIDVLLDNCVYGKIKFLYLSPERLSSELVKVRLSKMKISFLAIDEAHCISQWGYDFRPAYLRIAELRELLPQQKILALTATATPEVVKDIQQQLNFKNSKVFIASFERKNLAYIVLQEEDKWNRLLKIVTSLKGAGIIYARNRKRTQEIALFLQRNSITADYYHAGLSPQVRDTKQNNWMLNNCRIMVCTNAFGMGIDKPDVRFVVHLELPDSLEAYFQEAGRAGRDGNKSYGIVLFQSVDSNESMHRLKQGFPTVSEIKSVYQALCNYYKLAIGSGLEITFDFDSADFCNTFNLKANHVFNCLKFLEKEEYLSLSDSSKTNAKLKILLNKQALFDFQVANKDLDILIKTILRSYSGAFDEFILISETELAKRTAQKKEDIIKQLNYLNKLKVISYFPQSFLPQLTFTRARVDVKKLTISAEVLSKRFELAAQKLNAVIHYAESTKLCRSQMLLHYFGESTAGFCGVCDVCLAKNKTLNLTSEMFTLLTNKITSLLQTQKLPLKSLVKLMEHKKEKQSILVIQHLLDSGILLTENEVYFLADKK